MKTTVIPGQVCASCGYQSDAATSMTGQRSPKSGDVSICINCAAINVFDIQLKLIKPDDGQLLDLMLSDDWQYIERTQHAVINQSKLLARHQPTTRTST